MAMTTAVPPSTLDLDVEMYDWVPTSQLARVVAEFARMQILVTLFDTDPDKWLDFIRRYGTEDELRQDVPFLVHVRERLAEDPTIGADMKRIVAEVATLLAPRPMTS